METLMHQPLANVIARFPALGKLLSAHGVNVPECVSSSRLLKDVFQNCALSPQEAQRLMAEVRNHLQHLLAEEPLTVPIRNHPEQERSGLPAQMPEEGQPLAEPLQSLRAEHERQRRLLSLIPRLIARNDLFEKDRRLIEGILDHAHRYTDQFHHFKEEKILFTLPTGSHPFIQAMTAEHETARALLQQAGEDLHFCKAEELEDVLTRYVDLMRQHIHRENDVLFPWFSRVLDSDQIARLTEQFDKLDTKEGSSLEGELEAFMESAETTLSIVTPTVMHFSVLREKTMERLVISQDIAISHMILPAEDFIEGYETDTHVYFIITHGMVTIRHSDTQEDKHVQGTIVHFPPATWMEIRNEGPGTFEMFVVRAPNP